MKEGRVFFREVLRGGSVDALREAVKAAPPESAREHLSAARGKAPARVVHWGALDFQTEGAADVPAASFQEQPV